jgi:AbrB family looped-hinge helix DNA binding protein
MTMIVKVDGDGEIHIPSEMGEQMGVKKGDRLEVSLHDGQMILKPKKSVSFEKFIGAFPIDEDPVKWVRNLREDAE